MMSDANNLFELKRILSCSATDRRSKQYDDWTDELGNKGLKSQSGVVIKIFSWTIYRNDNCICLAIYLSNARLVLYHHHENESDKPKARQIPWYSDQTKEIVALTFSPNGEWLLIVVKDSAIYLIPALKLMKPLADVEPKFPLDDITEIQFQGRRASPTSVLWWETSDGRSIAIVGNELGEISFVNLMLSREVGGTYIPIGISHLELIEDALNLTVYLLITGVNRVQWQLILEKQDPVYCWPLENHLASSNKNESSGIFGMQSPILLCLASCDSKRPVNDANQNDAKPKRLDSFAGHTFLQLQSSVVPNEITGYYEQTSIISMHSPSLQIVPLSVYKVPANTIKFVVQNKVIIVVSPLESRLDQKYAVQIISAELASSNIDGVKEFNHLSRLQYFYLDPEDEILSIVCWKSFSYIVATNKNIYHLRLRVKLEETFTQMVLQEGDTLKAERFVQLYGLNLSELFEKVADLKLAEGLVTAAIRLYQTAKCPHSQNVAKFASHGHVSEVLSYIRVLLSSKNCTLSMGELIQCSNIALFCYLHQHLESSSNLQFNNFRLFLRENQYFDEKMAIHLLAKYGFYSLLTELADVRGKFCYVMEEMLPLEDSCNFWPDEEINIRPPDMDGNIVDVLVKCGFENLTRLEYNDMYIECFLHNNLVECFDLREDLLWRHMSLTSRLHLLKADRLSFTKRLLNLYKPAILKYSYFLTQSRDESTYDRQFNKIQRNSETCKTATHRHLKMSLYFLKLMLAVISFKDWKYDFNYLLGMPCKLLKDVSENITYICKRKIVDCGFAHSAIVVNGDIYTWGRTQDGCLGREGIRSEWLPAQPILLLQNFQIRVISVSCGAAHTLVLTNSGVYSWGSNRFGQLGLGQLVPSGLCCQRNQPTSIVSLSTLNICDIVCGQYHNLVITIEGIVYSWGWGVHGQLGHGDANNVDIPTQIIALKEEFIMSVSAGYAHSLFQTKNGEVFACGCGAFGQLGNGISNKINSPLKVNIDDKVVLVSAGYFHNVVVGASGRLFSWGCNPQTLRIRAQVSRRARIMNQTSPLECIANITSAPGVFNPTEIDRSNICSPISQIACGSNHTVILTTDGELFSWGRNLDGQLGVEDKKEKITPVLVVAVNDRKIVQLACGCDYTLMLDSAGKLWGFGVDNYGQICGAVERGKWSQPDMVMSPNKIITVRTNRRVVQIKSPTRNSVYKPLLLNEIPQVYDTKDSCQRTSSVDNILVRNFNVDDECADIFHENLHHAIEVLHGIYDVDAVKSLCIEKQMYQAAAKVTLISNLYSESFGLNLKCIETTDKLTDDECCSTVLNLLAQYLSFVKNDCQVVREILSAIILFWLSRSLEFEILEDFLKLNMTDLLVPLSYIIFGKINGFENGCPLSSEFCLDVVFNFMGKISEGELNSECAALLSDISFPNLNRWTESVEEEKIDDESSQKSFIDISSSELDSLRQILPATSIGDSTGSSKEASVIKIYSCGHLYTLGSFHRIALPLLKDSLNYFVPSSTMQLTEHYSNLEFQPMACPKCLVVGFHQDRLELAHFTS